MVHRSPFAVHRPSFGITRQLDGGDDDWYDKPMPEKPKPESRRAAWLIPLIIFTCAFVIRMAFVAQVKDCPYWRVPLVDAETYDEAAREMLNKSWVAPLPTAEYPYYPYSQPPFYHAFLAVLYLVLGRSVLAAIIVQYLIGSLCCVLTYFIGARFFDRRIGIAAGIAMALTASEIFYEGRLLPPVLITLLNLTIILLAAKQIKQPAVWRWPAIGLLIGLSAITRPDILLFAPAFLIWMWLERKTLLPRRPLIWTSVVILGMALPVGLVSLRNLVVGNDFAFISTNGGVNFLIGNHPNMEKMLGIRPGIEWNKLMYAPMAEGAVTPSQVSSYFYRRAAQLMWKYKRITIGNLCRKLVWIWRGQEIKRNEDDYYLTRFSPLYRALLWRVGPTGFPFGIIGPFALLGLVLCFSRRRELSLLYAYVATQALMLVVFFPCSRYRVPMAPVLLIFGAAAAFEVIQTARRKRFGDLATLLCLLLAFGFASTIYPPKFEGTPVKREAENYWLLALAAAKEGRPDDTVDLCGKGLALVPKHTDLLLLRMLAFHKQGDYAKSEQDALKCLKLAPGYRPIYTTLLDIYERQGKYDEAEGIRAVLESAPSVSDPARSYLMR
jgi:4-amino-4-deoxy-L-arabinose transferase-like glycosyltransferase